MKKALIIEDNDDIREGTAEILDLAGYETLTAKNGKIGVDLAVKHLPDIILCDIMMPELDGYETMKIIRKNIKHKDFYELLPTQFEELLFPNSICLPLIHNFFWGEPQDSYMMLYQ